MEQVNIFYSIVISIYFAFLHQTHTWNSTIFKKGSVRDWTVTIPCTQEAIIRVPLTPSYVVQCVVVCRTEVLCGLQPCC